MNRVCDTCSLCCKLLEVRDSEFNKSRDVWCQHCRRDNGCSIYAVRPQACRNFVCQWLIDPDIPDFFWPKRSHMVLGFNEERSIFTVEVDKKYPNIWRNEPYLIYLRAIALQLLTKPEPVPTVIRVTPRSWYLLPNKCVEVKGTDESVYSVVRISNNQWELIEFANQQQAEEQLNAVRR